MIPRKRDRPAATAGLPPTEEAPPRRSAGFYVYAARPGDPAKVHRGNCPHCGRGRGHLRQGHKPKGESWSGPFPTREVALERARRVGRRVETCGHCKP